MNGPGFEPLHDELQDSPIRKVGMKEAWRVHENYSASAEDFIKRFISSGRLVYRSCLDPPGARRRPKASWSVHYIPPDEPVDELVCYV